MKKIFDDDIQFYLQDDFFVSSQNFSAKKCLTCKIVKNSRFLKIYVQNFRVFQLIF